MVEDILYGGWIGRPFCCEAIVHATIPFVLSRVAAGLAGDVEPGQETQVIGSTAFWKWSCQLLLLPD